jgi:hypothetical protein
MVLPKDAQSLTWHTTPANKPSQLIDTGSKFLARLEAKLNSFTATSIPYDRKQLKLLKGRV